MRAVYQLKEVSEKEFSRKESIKKEFVSDSVSIAGDLYSPCEYNMFYLCFVRMDSQRVLLIHFLKPTVH